jgi:2-polyprenyl-6-methoxyphenol hydroxylase-like FAD-dependent oxidoreductase
MTVLVAGGGIAGLSLALTCHQIGVPVQVFEAVPDLQPLGVGINLQPNAVRELYDLGFEGRLDEVGLRTTEWALVGRNGNDVWSEPRGLLAGYDWPQYSVHRGQLQMLLYETVLERLGPEAVHTGHRVTGYRKDDGRVLATIERTDGSTVEVAGDVLVACDGLHSALRAQMYPDEGDPIWGGAVMWRGTAPGVPIRSGAAFVLVGSMNHRFVCYPISQPDLDTGTATINWIAELTFDPASQQFEQSDWNRPVPIDKFIGDFEDWNWDWLDVPALIRASGEVLEYPMVDRDPLPSWVDGRLALAGDAAHVMYPVGSNGASQAIVDVRVLGARFLELGVGPDALRAYDDALRTGVNELILRNRGAGPIAILGVVDERCGGVFDDIEDVIPRAEIDEFMARYKAAAGFAIETLNNAPPTIAP